MYSSRFRVGNTLLTTNSVLQYMTILLSYYYVLNEHMNHTSHIKITNKSQMTLLTQIQITDKIVTWPWVISVRGT